MTIHIQAADPADHPPRKMIYRVTCDRPGCTVTFERRGGGYLDFRGAMKQEGWVERRGSGFECPTCQEPFWTS